MSESTRFVVGIDLGTTNCALAYVDLAEGEGAPLRDFAIPQLVRLGVVEARPTLPSFLLSTRAGELPPGALDLPWESGAASAVGTLARDHGAKVPDRLVSSAKSWLVYGGADRRGAILPPGDHDGERVSPVQALARYLAHLRAAWDHEWAAQGESARFDAQQVVLTVPASFDPVARQLTVEAAEAAGLSRERLTLLEEPTAAMYAWVASLGDGWRSSVEVGDRLLVCDVGGGTSDFSLISVAEQEGALALERVAVGEHILLGGDNMDIMLAHLAQQRLGEQGVQLDAWQSRELWYACREAKEALLGPDAPAQHTLVVKGRGSKLIGGQIKTELWRDDILFALEAFFPEVDSHEGPQRARGAGLRQVGLPYAQDAAITRHLAGFLRRHAAALGSDDLARPTGVLFNGGVFKSPSLRERVVGILDRWLHAAGAAPVKVLEHDHLDLAVCRGAAYYGYVKRGGGVRIRGGTPMAYYIGVESSLPAIPGLPVPLQALCVAPMGMEEGTEASVGASTFHLAVGEPARFQFFGSATRRDDAPGALLDSASTGALDDVSTVEVELPAGEGAGVVPVRLRARVTEVGTLELWCDAVDERGSWKLEHDLRAGSGGADPRDPAPGA